MIGNVIAPFVGYVKPPLDPDDYFDPTTHIATEADFIRFLEDGGKYDDKSLVGYKVQLGNSVDYNNGLWVIADVNHDSENTGQTNCYDLISQDNFHSITYTTDAPYKNRWRWSNPRTWLNNTFYPGFSSAFKSRMIQPKYKSIDSWYTDDYVIIPSKFELDGVLTSDKEGVLYPIFTDNTSRSKKQFNTTTKANWYTRTRNNETTTDVYVVVTGGGIYSGTYDGSYNLAPILRVQ